MFTVIEGKRIAIVRKMLFCKREGFRGRQTPFVITPSNLPTFKKILYVCFSDQRVFFLFFFPGIVNNISISGVYSTMTKSQRQLAQLFGVTEGAISGVGFSVGASLPGGAWLAVLRWHALRNGLQRSGRRGIFKMHKKKGFKQVLEKSDSVFGFSKTNFYFEQRKVDQKLANGHAEQLFGKSAA